MIAGTASRRSTLSALHSCVVLDLEIKNSRISALSACLLIWKHELMPLTLGVSCPKLVFSTLSERLSRRSRSESLVRVRVTADPGISRRTLLAGLRDLDAAPLTDLVNRFDRGHTPSTHRSKKSVVEADLRQRPTVCRPRVGVVLVGEVIDEVIHTL